VRGPLLVIEPPPPSLLDARTRDEAAARVQAAESRLEQARASLREAKASETYARSEYGRVKRLSSAAPLELESAEMRQRTAQEKVRAAQFGVQVAEYELQVARAALQFTEPVSSAETSAWRLEVPPPIEDGRVLRVMKESATVVTPGEEILEVGDPQNLEAEIDLLTTDAVKVKPGARVLLEHWGGERPLEGHVRLIEPSGFTKRSALGVEEQRVNVLIDFTVPEEYRGAVGDAYRVEARIIVWEGRDVRKVPAGALFRTADKDWAVFVMAEGRAERRLVKVGHNNGLEAEVLDGLAEGEQVVMHPSDKIKDGVAIAPRGSP
jgi:HlyD family secretion protein